MPHTPDIVIFGAGIAGLWAFHALKRLGYDVLLLEKNAIGKGQTIAAQGIIHSGLKFTLAGKINPLAARISKMPDIWRACLNGEGPVDLRGVKINTPSQSLLIPAGFMGGITNIITQKTFGDRVKKLSPDSWPADLKKSGFSGSIIAMAEMVLDVPSILQTLAKPYQECIRHYDGAEPFAFLKNHGISPKKIIFTTAADNARIAAAHQHDKGLQVQHRPLMQAMMIPAPFPLFAHFIGTSDKPVATITTHTARNGDLIWYFGAGVAEHPKETPPTEIFARARAALKTYLPQLDVTEARWAVLPIDRVEGKSKTDHWLPDTPTIHRAGDVLYAWPTKLTFAPLLSDMLLEALDLTPSHTSSDFGFLPAVDFAPAPWDEAIWTK